MKSCFAIVILVVLFSSCKVPLATVTSKQVPQKGNWFIYENDTLKITYDFWGNLGVMKFEIYNKLDKPIFVDLKNSAFIPNENMISYWRDEVNTESNAAYGYNFYGTPVSKGKSQSVRKERIIVIPPNSKIKKPTYTLVPNKNAITNQLIFRNYLSISTNEKFEGVISHVDNQFQVASVVQVTKKQVRAAVSPSKFYAAKTDL